MSVRSLCTTYFTLLSLSLWQEWVTKFESKFTDFYMKVRNCSFSFLSLFCCILCRDRPKFGFGYGVSAETTPKYGFGLVSVTAKRNGRITVSDETWPRGDRNQPKLDQQRELQRLAIRRRNFPEAVGWTTTVSVTMVVAGLTVSHHKFTVPLLHNRRGTGHDHRYVVNRDGRVRGQQTDN